MIELRFHVPADDDEVERLREILAGAGYRVAGAEENGAGSLRIARPPTDADHLVARIEDLERTVLELRNVDAARSQFLTNVSHELRTPLTAVVTYGEVLRDGLLGDLGPRQLDAVKSIIGSARQLLSMIEEILTYAKANARGVELQECEFEVEEVLGAVYEMNASLIHKKRLRFERDTPADLPPARGDRDKLLHVLGNLLGNAIEFTPDRGSVAIRVDRVEDDPSWLRFTVEDTGIGIDATDHEMIFEAFAQVDSSRSRQHHGTGLGLAIARNFVHLHGGEIWVESSLGAGSRFHFTLPSAEAPVRTEEEEEA
jgi:signal transduction histidine kinase